MSDPTNQTAVKKKSKKRKKKTKGQQGDVSPDNNASQQVHKDKLPKQTSDKGEQHITTSKCCRCKGTFRQMTQNGLPSSAPGQANWMCPTCEQAVKAEDTSKFSSYSTPSQSTVTSSTAVAGGCNCAACVAKRENSVTPEVEKEAHITQTQWMEIRQIVRCIYRENMQLSNQSNRASIGSDKMRLIVKKLCSRDPHQFFQRLETLAREYLLEVKVRLLEQLSCGFNSPQLAIEFIQMLLDEYSALCNALPALLYLLAPLEECEYVHKLGMTIELMNKNIFRELIFAESFMSSNLPLIIAQLRLASLASDSYHRKTADELSQRYMALDQEMEEISHIWRSAKDHLNTHQDLQRKQLEKKKAHLEKIRADGESFKQMKREQQAREKSRDDMENSKPRPSEVKHPPPVKTTPTALMPASIHSVLTSASEGQSLKSKQALEWSRLLFKCIKPVGEPEFRLNGDIATHTITLHLDMTELDLSSTKPVCTRRDLRRYRQLGLSVEEVVEVAMKLNTLGALGINLKIEDLFDNEGFSLSDINESLVGSETLEAGGDKVYFIDDEMEAARSRERAARMEAKGEEPKDGGLDDEVDLQRAWEVVLHRQESNNGRSRQQDFLQGMTMKIRFMKRLTVEDLDKNFLADGGRVIFNACDQVQMKLTQLELNSVRVVANGDCVGDDLGLQNEQGDPPPMKPLSGGEKTLDDYTFVHTGSHKEFMDLLLEKRKQLETLVSNKQREKRAMEEALKKEEKIREEVIKKEETIHEEMIKSEKTTEEEETKSEKERTKDETTKKETDNSESDALRYEVKVQQESTPVSRPPVQERPPAEFKPVYLSNSTQPCQCSACVGAMAATIQPSYHRPLNPTDPSASSLTIECSLSAHIGPDKMADLSGEDKGKDKGGKKRTNPPMTKEGLWQNWMSTSGSAQIENDSQLHNGTHHHHHHHSHYGCCHGDVSAEGDSGYGDSIKGCPGPCSCVHDHQSTTASGASSCAMPCSSHNHTGSSSPVSTSTCQTSATSNTGGAGGGGESTGSTNESSRRYCPCCYCELFGHNGPPTAPTSHNFTKQRDKMRAKLEDKRKRRDKGSSKGGHGGDSSGVGKESSVEELLAFIEGGDGENESHTSSRAAKRQRRKQKKQASSIITTNSTEDSTQPNGTSVAHSESPELSNGPSKTKTAPSNGKSGKKGGQPSASKEGESESDNKEEPVRNVIENGKAEDKLSLSSTESDLSGAENDDYDDELEEFKKFCFASAPVENRKKIAVPLNMNAFMSKVK